MTVTTTYRVECNNGSRYFDDEIKAIQYYNKQERKGYKVEIWICTKRVSPNLFAMEQVLVMSTSFKVVIKL